MIVMMRGMPGGMQVNRASSPCPPLAWSARLASNSAWYSGVSGACWPRPKGLGLIPLDADPARPVPLPRPVGILGFVEGLRNVCAHGDREAKRSDAKRNGPHDHGF